jgi:hypothetical protein
LFAGNVQLLLLFSTVHVGCEVFGWTHVWWFGLVCGVLIDNDQVVGQERRIREDLLR